MRIIIEVIIIIVLILALVHDHKPYHPPKERPSRISLMLHSNEDTQEATKDKRYIYSNK